MHTRTYWLDLFSGASWQEFLDAGASVSGFRESRWKTVRQMKPGDYLLCYMTGIGRWIGVLEVTSEGYQDDTPIWKDDVFPSRVSVRLVVALTPETAVPIMELRNELSIFENLTNPNAWTGHLRGSPARWSQVDGQIVVSAIMAAKSNPVVRPVDEKKLQRRPPLLKTKLGLVPAPEPEPEPEQEMVPPKEVSSTGDDVAPAVKEARLHSEVQWLLLKLGNDMGLDIWIAQNDKNLEVNGQKVSSLSRLKKDLPLQFDEFTNRIIRLIDVLWLRGNTIVAAFEIECTTSIYSGLLRMSDLIAVQPNLKIPLYIVAPDDRRDKVCNEMNRPTFKRLTPPMPRTCMFISISALKERLNEVQAVVRFLKPEFLEDLAESCEITEP
jgi:hypothetical protein